MNEDDRKPALSRHTDPETSQEIDEIAADLNVQEAILALVGADTVRACGERCGYMADFEITAALKDLERYDGSVRRQVRILREDGRLVTPYVKGTRRKPKHKHLNITPGKKTWKNQQCHRLPLSECLI